MLKAAVIYVQGSGGNLLARTLSLCEQTVPYVPENLAQAQPTLQMSQADRFNYYNNWNSDNWVASENLRIWYHDNSNIHVDFVEYEKSPLGLIDQFHPEAFETETQRGLLWESANQWPHIIFIKYKHSSLENIIKLVELKRPDIKNNRIEILTHEIPAFNRLTSIYSGYSVYWEDMLIHDNYVSEITKIANQIGLKLNLDLVSQLWTSWKQQTDQLLAQ